MRDVRNQSTINSANCTIANTQPLYLSRKALGEFLGIGERKAIELLAQHGVKPIDLGRGRGNGLRWLTSAVIAVADILHTEAQAKKCSNRRKTNLAFTIKGKTAAQLFAEFNGYNSLNKEVCNGN